nr:hypothetical protein 1 [Candidatus Hydrogenedentota bacterium]
MAKFDKKERQQAEWHSVHELRQSNASTHLILPINRDSDKVILYRGIQEFAGNCEVLLKFLKHRLSQQKSESDFAKIVSLLGNELSKLHNIDSGKFERLDKKWKTYFRKIVSTKEQNANKFKDITKKKSGWTNIWDGENALRIGDIDFPKNPVAPKNIAQSLDSVISNAKLGRIHGDANLTNAFVGFNTSNNEDEYVDNLFLIDFAESKGSHPVIIDFARFEAEFFYEVFAESLNNESLCFSIKLVREYIDYSVQPKDNLSNSVQNACYLLSHLRYNFVRLCLTANGANTPKSFVTYHHCLYLTFIRALLFQSVRGGDRRKIRAALLGAAYSLKYIYKCDSDMFKGNPIELDNDMDSDPLCKRVQEVFHKEYRGFPDVLAELELSIKGNGGMGNSQQRCPCRYTTTAIALCVEYVRSYDFMSDFFEIMDYISKIHKAALEIQECIDSMGNISSIVEKKQDACRGLVDSINNFDDYLFRTRQESEQNRYKQSEERKNIEFFKKDCSERRRSVLKARAYHRGLGFDDTFQEYSSACDKVLKWSRNSDRHFPPNGYTELLTTYDSIIENMRCLWGLHCENNSVEFVSDLNISPFTFYQGANELLKILYNREHHKKGGGFVKIWKDDLSEGIS